MANIKTTYQAFREWLIWVRGNDSQTAKCTVAYLRNLESNLFESKIDGGKLSVFHKNLITIDQNPNCGFNLGYIIKALKDLKELIDTERKNESGKSKFGFETIKNWSRAFNSYLAFLCDVTDCFTQLEAKEINSRFGVGNKNVDVESPNYVKRLDLFISGAHKHILDTIGIQGLTDQLLDTFHNVVKSALQNMGMKNSIPTEFLINSSFSPAMINWRTIILDNIRCDYIPNKYDCKIFESLSYNINIIDPYDDLYGIDSRCTDIFESVMRAYRCLASNLGVDRYSPLQIDALQRKILECGSTDSVINGDFIGHIWHIHDIIKDYSRLFEIKFEH